MKLFFNDFDGFNSAVANAFHKINAVAEMGDVEVKLAIDDRFADDRLAECIHHCTVVKSLCLDVQYLGGRVGIDRYGSAGGVLLNADTFFDEDVIDDESVGGLDFVGVGGVYEGNIDFLSSEVGQVGKALLESTCMHGLVV